MRSRRLAMAHTQRHQPHIYTKYVVLHNMNNEHVMRNSLHAETHIRNTDGEHNAVTVHLSPHKVAVNLITVNFQGPNLPCAQCTQFAQSLNTDGCLSCGISINQSPVPLPSPTQFILRKILAQHTRVRSPSFSAQLLSDSFVQCLNVFFFFSIKSEKRKIESDPMDWPDQTRHLSMCVNE